MKIRSSAFSLSLAFALCTPFASSVTHAQKISLKNFIPAANWSNISRYSCYDRLGKTVDVELNFGLRRNSEGGGYVGELYSMTFGGTKTASPTIKRINEVVASRTIENVSVSCQEGGAIQMHFSIWGAKRGSDPSTASSTSITVVRKSDGKFDIR
jgi:hypothetical protein